MLGPQRERASERETAARARDASRLASLGPPTRATRLEARVCAPSRDQHRGQSAGRLDWQRQKGSSVRGVAVGAWVVLRLRIAALAVTRSPASPFVSTNHPCCTHADEHALAESQLHNTQSRAHTVLGPPPSPPASSSSSSPLPPSKLDDGDFDAHSTSPVPRSGRRLRQSRGLLVLPWRGGRWQQQQ